jgi:hypothetical protein
VEKNRQPDQPIESGDPELREVFDGVMRDWKEGKLTYDNALAIYTAKALKKAIERSNNKQ